MLFQCRQCRKTSADIDQVLEGSCDCGCSAFRLVSEEDLNSSPEVSTRESLRRDLHRWIDLNVDTLSTELLENISVTFHCDEQE